MKRLVAIGIAICITFSASGCAGTSLARYLAPASGRVTVKGKPLTRGVIIFIPDPSRGNNCPEEGRSMIYDDGTYEIETREFLGAPRGWCRVAIVAKIDPESSTSREPTIWLAHQKYMLADTSGLAVEVLDSQREYDFDLEPPEPEKASSPPTAK